jgi:hypothetical protein
MQQSINPGNARKKRNAENRPIRVYAAILVLVVLIAGILYFTRDTPIPKEIRDAVSIPFPSEHQMTILSDW